MKNRYCSDVISENGKYLENSLKGFVRGWRTNGGEHIQNFVVKKGELSWSEGMLKIVKRMRMQSLWPERIKLLAILCTVNPS